MSATIASTVFDCENMTDLQLQVLRRLAWDAETWRDSNNDYADARVAHDVWQGCVLEQDKREAAKQVRFEVETWNRACECWEFHHRFADARDANDHCDTLMDMGYFARVTPTGM